jgi:hypothetical protein
MMAEGIALFLLAGMAFVFWKADKSHDPNYHWVGDQMGGHYEKNN